MVIKRCPGGESAGGGWSTSKSTCVVPAWTLTSENASFGVCASRWSHQLTSDTKRCLLFRKCYQRLCLKAVSMPAFVIGGLRGSTTTSGSCWFRDVVCKSSGLCAGFQLLGAASIQVRLLFDGGLHAMLWVCKIRKSSRAHVKIKKNLSSRLLQDYFKCNQTIDIQKAVGFCRPSTLLDHSFPELRLLFECC